MIGTSDHAIESLSLFYPRADGPMVLGEVARGVEVEAGVAARLVGRHHLVPGSAYVLHRERTGLFVLAGDTVVTFLRFYSLHQHELAVLLWPGGDAPTCAARWNGHDSRLEPAASLPVRLSPRVSSVVHKTYGGGAGQRLKSAIRDAVGTGALEPPGDYSHDLGLAGILQFEGVTIGVCLREQAIHAVIPGLRPEVQSARDRAVNAQRAQDAKAERAWEKQERGEQQAAAFLRSRGWTCTPPSGGQEGT